MNVFFLSAQLAVGLASPHLQSVCDKEDSAISLWQFPCQHNTSIGSMDYLALVTWSGFTSYHSIKYRP